MSFLAQLAQSTQYNTYNSTYQSTATPEDAAIMAGALLIYLIIVLVAYVIGALLLGRIFKKAGVEPWKAWVPIYSLWITYELGDQKGYWAILWLVPFINIVAAIFYIIAQYHIGLKLGKSGAFVLLGIFFPVIWLAILAFDKSTWQGTGAHFAAAPAGPAPQPSVPQQNNWDNQNNNPTPPTPPTQPLQ